MILSEGGLITAAEFGVTPTARGAEEPAPSRAAENGESPAAMQALPEMERQAIVEALRRAKGNKSQAATTLGLSRTRFYTLLRRSGLD